MTVLCKPSEFFAFFLNLFLTFTFTFITLIRVNQPFSVASFCSDFKLKEILFSSDSWERKRK